MWEYKTLLGSALLRRRIQPNMKAFPQVVYSSRNSKGFAELYPLAVPTEV